MTEEPVTEETHIRLGKRVRLDAVLAVVALLPRPVTLYVEGTSIVPAVRAALEGHEVEPGRTDLAGTGWPSPERFHVSVTDPLMEELQRLAESLAGPEVLDHLVAYDASGHIQLAAYDAGFEPIWVARDLPPDVAGEIAVIARRR